MYWFQLADYMLYKCWWSLPLKAAVQKHCAISCNNQCFLSLRMFASHPLVIKSTFLMIIVAGGYRSIRSKILCYLILFVYRTGLVPVCVHVCTELFAPHIALIHGRWCNRRERERERVPGPCIGHLITFLFWVLIDWEYCAPTGSLRVHVHAYKPNTTTHINWNSSMSRCEFKEVEHTLF